MSLHTKRWLEIGEAVERASTELPDGFDLHIEIEKGAGIIRLHIPPTGDDDSGEVLDEWNGDSFGAQINNAIEYAIELEKNREGDKP